MKKILAVLLASVALFTFTATAQRAELRVAYGGYTQMDATDLHDGWGNLKPAWGVANIGLNFRLIPGLWIGPSYSLSTTSTKGGPLHSHVAYHVVMMNARYQYWKNSIVKLYGHIGLGADISYMQPLGGKNFNKSYFAYQFSPLGAQVDLAGGFGIFGEVGFGAQGLVQIGCRIGI